MPASSPAPRPWMSEYHDIIQYIYIIIYIIYIYIYNYIYYTYIIISLASTFFRTFQNFGACWDVLDSVVTEMCLACVKSCLGPLTQVSAEQTHSEWKQLNRETWPLVPAVTPQPIQIPRSVMTLPVEVKISEHPCVLWNIWRAMESDGGVDDKRYSTWMSWVNVS